MPTPDLSITQLKKCSWNWGSGQVQKSLVQSVHIRLKKGIFRNGDSSDFAEMRRSGTWNLRFQKWEPKVPKKH